MNITTLFTRKTKFGITYLKVRNIFFYYEAWYQFVMFFFFIEANAASLVKCAALTP
jgi:hypothetical protein